MSIRRSPQLTPQLLDAARSNGRRTHGARTAAGKLNSKMNAVKQGERSDPENHYAVMRALGEDPAEFEALKQELAASFGPGDAFLKKQIDDLARLYWRRDRIERFQAGLMRRALQAVDDWQHRRRLEIEGATFGPSQALNTTLQEPADPAARLRLLLSFLGLIRVQVRARSFLAWQACALQGFYGKKGGWRAARLCHLLSLFAESASRDAGAVREPPLPSDAEGGDEEPASAAALAEPADEPQYKELLQLLEEEMAGVLEEFEYAEKVNEQKAAIERDACLAPAGEEWRMLLRREEALDRSIDRKIKLLLGLRKEAERSPAALEPTALSPSESPALSPGERVSRPGDFTSRSVTGEASRPREEQPAARPHPDNKPRDVATSRRDEKIDERPGYVDENNREPEVARASRTAFSEQPFMPVR